MSESIPTVPSSPDDGAALRPERLGPASQLASPVGGGGALRPERLGEELRPERLGALAGELPGWRVEGGRALVRTFHWPDRAAALAFVHLAALAGDALGAAPEVHLAGASVTVRLAGRGGALTEAEAATSRALDGRWGEPATD